MISIKKRILSFITAAVVAVAILGFFPPLSLTAGAETDPRIIVCLGDSYSSGEGIEPFFGQTKATAKKVKDQDWLAHRSKKAWPSLLKLDGVKMTRGENWYFAAASGAETKHLTTKQKKEYKYDGVSGSADLDPQINIFNGLKLTSNDYVTVTIGGNDIGFVSLLTSAAVGKDALKTTIEKSWEKFNKNVKADIKSAYKTIESAAGTEATIIVAGYPRLINPDGFTITAPVFGSVTVDKDTAAMINSAVDDFNDALKALVNECRTKDGMKIYFVSVTNAFSGHEAYTEDPYINSAIFEAKSQDLMPYSIRNMVSAYSLHPNESGAKAYASAVQKMINKLDASGGSTDTKPADNTAAVQQITASIDGSSATLKWDAVKGVESYNVYVDKNGRWKKLKTTSKTEYTVNKLKNNTTYTFMVRADVDGESDSCQITVTVCYKPVVSATVKKGKVVLNWTEVNNAEKYAVYKYANGSWTLVKETKKLTMSISDVKSGKTYKYAVCAYVNNDWTKIGTASTAKVKVK